MGLNTSTITSSTSWLIEMVSSPLALSSLMASSRLLMALACVSASMSRVMPILSEPVSASTA
ncbi:hypothetical protein [Achromobacter phage kwar_LB4]|nr:hypothetical protein [Achromobacter phage kwar_LB4]